MMMNVEGQKQSRYLFNLCYENREVSAFLLLFINGMISEDGRKMVIENMDKIGVDEKVITFYKMMCYHNDLGVESYTKMGEDKEW